MRWFRRTAPPPHVDVAALEHEVLDTPLADDFDQRVAEAVFKSKQPERDAARRQQEYDNDKRAERYLKRHGIIP